MNRKIRQVIIYAALLAGVSAFGQSNPIEGGSTETVSNEWNVPVPWLMVGSNTGSNTLAVVDGGQVNSQSGYLGNTAGSTHNEAIVSGSGVWSNSTELSVGYVGDSNRLTVTGGGTVSAPEAYIGNMSDGNQAAVTGTNSLLDAEMLNVGHQGSGNSLLVTDGGSVVSDTGTIGYWIGSDNNTATVQSNGSWTADELNVGEYGSGNQLAVGAGGLLDADVVNVGAQSGSSDNTVSVSGSGALLDTSELYIGGSASGAGGTNNSVAVSDGGTVSTESLTIYDDNAFELNDGGSLVISTNFDASTEGFNWNAGGTLEVGGELTGMGTTIEDQKTLILSGSNALWDNSEGLSVGGSSDMNRLVVANGGHVESGNGSVGSSSDGNSVLVSGDGSDWSISRNFFVGDSGAGNSLVINDGGYVEASWASIGYTADADHNRVVVDGERSEWDVDTLYVGNQGSGNSLIITNGGRVTTGYTYVGAVEGAENNSVHVDGAGSAWNCSGILGIGLYSAGNNLVIQNGGVVTDETGYIGNRSSSVNNSVIVSGDNSAWINSSALIVGSFGSGNSLVIENGGRVENTVGCIGLSSGGSSNSVLVTGRGSVWQNYDSVYLGGERWVDSSWKAGGTGNSLTVEDGGQVLVGDVDTNNLSGIKGIVVGDADGAEMVVANGSHVTNAYEVVDWDSYGGLTYIGLGTNESGSVLVTGEGTTWSEHATYVGYEGSSNSLTISDGARLDNHYTYLGYSEGSDGNHLLVTGSNTVLNSGVSIGTRGSGNSMQILDGALVSGDGISMGDRATSMNNTLIVSGAGTVVDAGDGVQVGWKGGSNSLVIADGALVQAIGGAIGRESSGNQVLVTGSNTVFELSEFLTVGQNSGNSLMVSDGGRVLTGSAYVGMGNPACGNRLTVTGNDSMLVSSNSLIIGFIGASGNSLIVTNGGRAENQNGYIGYESGADSNSVLVTGSGSTWQNYKALYVGSGGTGNSLTVEDGGQVLVGDVDANNLSGIKGIVVGDADGAEMVVANGSHVTNAYEVLDWDTYGGRTYIGLGTNESGTVLVTGEGTTWSDYVTYIGYEGSSNSLTISDGARMDNDYIIIGSSEGSDGNQLLVTGSNTVLNSDRSIEVGERGSDNTMEIMDGAQVSTRGLVLGIRNTSGNNSLVVSGTDTFLDTYDGGITVGYQGGSNNLVIADGAHVSSSNDGACIGMLSDGNEALVTGSNSLWNVSYYLKVGDEGSDNRLSITDGGLVQARLVSLGSDEVAENNRIQVSGAGSALIATNSLGIGMFGSGNELAVDDGGYVEVGGTGIGTFGDSNSVVVTGAGSVLDSGDNLTVGSLGSYNSLTVESSGSVYSRVGSIGAWEDADNNSVLVTGSGSLWQNYDGLYLGGRYDSSNNWVKGGTGNSLTVEAGGQMLVGDMDANNLSGIEGIVIGDASTNDVRMIVANGSLVDTLDTYIGLGTNEVGTLVISGSNTLWHSRGSFYLGSGGTAGSTLSVSDYAQVCVDGDYLQDAASLLRFGVVTNASGSPLTAQISVGGTAEFEAGAQIVYASNVGELALDRVYTNMLVEAATLVVAGITNAESSDLEQLDASGSLVDVMFWVNDDNLYALAGRVELGESAGFTNGGMMSVLSEEIDELSLSGNAGAVQMINLLNTMSGEEQAEELTQQYASGAPSFMHVQGLTAGLREITRHTSRSPSAASVSEPEGAAGPHSTGQGMRGWIKTHGSWAERTDADGFSGYDHNMYGTVVGVDQVQGNLLVGVAGGYVRSVLNLNNDDRSVAKTGYGAGYVSVGTDSWFADVQLALGLGDVEDASGSAFANAAEYKAYQAALYLGGGKALRAFDGRVIFTPEASILLSEYMQESYTETGLLPRDVDAYDRFSARSGLGASLAVQQEFEIVILRPELRCRWLHEFNADEESIDYSLVGSTADYQFDVAGAEEDLIEAGAGLTCTFNDELSLAVDVDWIFGDDYDAYTVAGRMVYEF